jgi:hypothetical protein
MKLSKNYIENLIVKQNSLKESADSDIACDYDSRDEIIGESISHITENTADRSSYSKFMQDILARTLVEHHDETETPQRTYIKRYRERWSNTIVHGEKK